MSICKNGFCSKISKLFSSLSSQAPPPPTVILSITTHGQIPVGKFKYKDIEGYAEKITTIPDGMELIKFTISPRGVVNCANINSTEQMTDIIIDNAEYLKLFQSRDVNHSINNDMIPEIKKINKHITEVVEKKMNDRQMINEQDYKHKKAFLNTATEGFNTFHNTGGDNIINKIYSRDLYETGPSDHNDMKISVIDKYSVKNYKKNGEPIFPDLLDTIGIQNDMYYYKYTTTEDILYYYYNKGIKRVIIFDFTCSVYVDFFKNTYINDLSEIRGEKIDMTYGGKNKQLKKKSNVTKKYRAKKIRRNKSMKKRIYIK